MDILKERAERRDTPLQHMASQKVHAERLCLDE